MFDCYSLLALVLDAIKSIRFIALDQRPLPGGLQHCGVWQNTKACQMGMKRLGARRVERSNRVGVAVTSPVSVGSSSIKRNPKG